MIITLCRYEHFVNCIESLQRNSYATQTEVYIGIDYPLRDSHMEGYKKICEYVDKGIVGFKEVHIIKQTVNLGPVQHFFYMRDIILQRYNFYIYTEDDNVFSQNYLEYMNKCLDYYENDETVLGVSGYMYPNCLADFSGNVTRVSTYFSAFGYGCYKRTDKIFDQFLNLDYFTEMFSNIKKMRQLRIDSPNQFCNFVKGMVEYIPDLIKDDTIPPTDLAYGLYMYFNGKTMIFPKLSKVRNNGYDGSGVNCGVQKIINETLGETYRDYDFAKQITDSSDVFGEIHEEEAVCINEELARFFCVTKKEKILSVVIYYLILVIGRKRVARLLKSFRIG